jgi:methylene-fatty-acyl-phospholipid synthase
LRFLGTPVDGVQRFFYVFKVIQVGVFLAWYGYFGDGSIASAWPVAVGLGIILVGQVLNFSVFFRLGKVGVYYGVRFGHEVPWCRDCPFSLLRHPQYVGAVMSIWGFFLITRFPHGDWLVLPALEPVYYALGAYYEQ